MLKWFRPGIEPHDREAAHLRAAFEGGRLGIVAPPLVRLEILNVAARKWKLDEPRLKGIAVAIQDLAFRLREPEIADVARWAGHELSAYDASYVAFAEAEGVQLVTSDARVCVTAPEIAVPLERWAAP